MRAPAPKRTDGIVAEIVEILEVPALESLVRMLINRLRANSSPFSGNRTANKQYLKRLREQTIKYKEVLEEIPEPLRTALFSPEFFGQLFALLGAVPGAALELNPQLRGYLHQRKPDRLTHLIEMLDWLCAQCGQIDLGMHGLADYQKLRAAIASREVLEEAINLYPEKGLSFADLEDSDYCRIASLFFEAITGEDNCNLRRQCRNVAP
jgi:hypothetical protein